MAFGTFIILMAFRNSYPALMVLRVLVGLGEVFVNNAFIFLTLWYKPEEVALRTGERDTELKLLAKSCALTCF